MKRLPIIFPAGGLAQVTSFEDQPALTSRAMSNVRWRNPKSGRYEGAQRSGQSKHTTAVISGAGNQVVAAMEVQHDVQNVTYSSAGNAPTIASTTLPAGRECLAAVTDRYGNVYCFDGPAALAKYNPDGNLVWKRALPAKDPGHVCRALWVDLSLRVFAGTSEGSNQKESRLWCIQQLEDDDTKILWEIAPERWIESIRDSSGMLYTIQNDSDFWKSYVVAFVGQDAADPTEIRNFGISYPVNGFTISPKDGSLFTTHEPNAQRGLDPRSPGTTASSVDWTPLDLASFSARIWGWWRADDIDGDDSFNSEYEDGDPIDLLQDRSGNFRHLMQITLTARPTLRKGAVAGRDALLFDGLDDQMISGLNVSADPAYRDAQRTIVPMDKKAQFALFGVVRGVSEATRRGLLGLPGTTKSRHIILNRRPGDTLAGAAGSAGEAYEGLFSYFEKSTGSADVAGGSDGHARDGTFDESGYINFAIIHNGGQTDVVGDATRSTVWINGSPTDRWISIGDFSGLAASTLGTVAGIAGFFQGYVCELLCLSDWSSPSNTLGIGAQTLNRLLTYPGGGGVNGWPDPVGASYWTAQSDTEFDRIHTYMGHRWGISHKLPAGKQEVVCFGGTPANNDTISLPSGGPNARVYTYKTTLTGAANEVHRGATPSAHEALRNLHRALNGTGTPGVDYGTGTAPNVTFRSVGIHRESNVTANPALVLRTREGAPGSANVSLASTIATSFFEYSSLAATGTAIGAGTVNSQGSGGSRGFYPTAFWLTATPQSEGGPPRMSGVTSTSAVGDANKPYGLLVKYDPASGKPRWTATSDAGNSGVAIGGIGYGVEANSMSELYCTGPRQAADLNGIFGDDNVDIRKIIDLGDTFDIAVGGSLATSAWTDASGEQIYHYPRLAVDQYDNVYVPVFQAAPGTSMIGFARTPVTGAGVKIVSVTTISNDPGGYAVAVDPRYPDYPVSFTSTRAEFVWLATELASGNANTLFKLELINKAQSNVSNSAIRRVALAKGATHLDLVEFTTPSSLVVIAAAAFDGTSRFIDSVSAFGQLFITDGHSMGVWKPKVSLYAAMRSTSSGASPLRPRLLALYRGRLVAARFEDNPHKIAWSKIGKPFNWDSDPPVATADEAVDGTIAQLGEFPDMVTGLLPIEDDLLLIGGARSIKVLRGDPAAGGVFDEIKCHDGMAFGRARCLDPYGGAWFVGAHGGLYRIGAGKGYAERVSDRTIPEFLADLDHSAYRVELFWNTEDRVVQIFLFPYSTGNTLKTHWVYDPAGKGFFPDTYGLAGIQPTCALVASGDTQGSRVLLLGSRDGFMRLWDKAAKSDDGTRIDSYVAMELAPAGHLGDVQYTNLEVTLTTDQNGCAYEVYAPKTPDVLGTAWFNGALDPGRNPYEPVIVTGRRAVVMLRGLPQGNTSFGFKNASIEMDPVGEALVR